VLRHGGKRSFTCQVCNRNFARLGTLNRHLRTHVDESLQDVEQESDDVCSQSSQCDESRESQSDGVHGTEGKVKLPAPG